MAGKSYKPCINTDRKILDKLLVDDPMRARHCEQRTRGANEESRLPIPNKYLKHDLARRLK